MLSTISSITSRRTWFVPRFSVWGSAQWCGIEYLAIEEADSTKSVLFNSEGIGDSSQSVVYKDLTDFRGNRLPATIKNPRVLVRSRSADAAFIVGDESAEGFRIAASATASSPVLVDLIVMEMGE